jgi:hypothetical protein
MRDLGRATTVKAAELAGAAEAVVSMVLGDGRVAHGFSADQWRATIELAMRECCGPLLWHRAGSLVRASAPADAVALLRGHAITLGFRQRAHLAVLRDTLDLLTARDVDVQCLKGLVLSQLAYGDPFVRPSADLDLLVPTTDRARARAALLGAGWSIVEGIAPFEEAFTKRVSGELMRLEVHSHLLGDSLAHLPAPEMVSVGIALEEREFPGLSLPLQALSLATHLAGHRVLPLLFAMDWYSIWSRMSDAERRAAERIAEEVRADAYLGRAREVADDVATVLRGGPSAAASLGALGFGATRGAIGDPFRLAIRAARTGHDRLATLRAWLTPARVRHGGRHIAVATVLRLLRRFRSAATKAVDDGARLIMHSTVPTIPVTDHQLAAFIEARRRAGADTTWVRSTGRSMAPTIPDGSLVRLRSTRDAPIALRRGDVVLARMPARGVVLHRVVRMRGGMLQLRGDGNVGGDPPVTLDAVVAVADAMMQDGRLRTLGRRGHASALLTARRAWAGLRARAASAGPLGREA